MESSDIVVAVFTRLFRSSDQSNHVFYLRTDIRGHLCGRSGTILQHIIIIGQFVHAQHNDIGTVLVLGSQLSDNGNAVQNGIAGGLDLFHSSHDSVQVSLDAVGHGTIGFVQMADGHDVADVAEDDTGQLQLIVFHIGSTVVAQHVTVDSGSDNDRGIGNAAVNHKFLVLIQYQQACHR